MQNANIEEITTTGTIKKVINIVLQGLYTQSYTA